MTAGLALSIAVLLIGVIGDYLSTRRAISLGAVEMGPVGNSASRELIASIVYLVAMIGLGSAAWRAGHQMIGAWFIFIMGVVKIAATIWNIGVARKRKKNAGNG